MFDLTPYNTFNLTVFCKEGRTITTVDDLKQPLNGPFIVLGGGSDVLFTEDFEGTVLINQIYGITLNTVFKSGKTVTSILKPEKDAHALANEASNTSYHPDSSYIKSHASALSSCHNSVKSSLPCDMQALSQDEKTQDGSVQAGQVKAKDEQAQAQSQAQGEDEVEFYRVRIGGGEILDETIEVLLNHGISGMENLSLIPGTVGAAPIQNIGAYGVEIGDMIESVEAFDFASGKLIVMSNSDCQFGYRSSYFKQHKERALFITHVNLIFKPGFKPHQSYAGLQSLEFKDGMAVRNRVIALRNLKLPNPSHVGNAGSFFKNPYVSAQVLEKLKQQYENVPAYAQEDGSYKLAAGWLIDKAGCRGIRHGQAGTWGNQALVIVNLGQAKPHEIVAMAKYVSAEVKSKFGLDLWPEVRLYGRHGEKEWDQI